MNYFVRGLEYGALCGGFLISFGAVLMLLLMIAGAVAWVCDGFAHDGEDGGAEDESADE